MLQYVEKASAGTGVCANCVHYERKTADDSYCGGCDLIPGPVSPLGYCLSFAEKVG